jgi:hypothetical protein
LWGFRHLTLQQSPLFSTMRHSFQAEPDLQITPIEKIRLPLRSRDELPPMLAGLQWLWMHPTLRAEMDEDVPVGGADVDQSIPVADRLLGRYGAGRLASLSFDKGFTRAEDRKLLSLCVPTVVMPRRGKKNAAELERESGKKFVALRQEHSGVESEINSLEHHGLNCCLDVGLHGYLCYVDYGVMSYNLHVIGRELLARQWARAAPARQAA